MLDAVTSDGFIKREGYGMKMRGMIQLAAAVVVGSVAWGAEGDANPVPLPVAVEQKVETPIQEKAVNTMVLIKTSKGDIKVELFDKQAPETVKSFLQYVDAKFYSGTIFHRVIASFMIQGGGFTRDYKQKATKAPVKNEAGNGEKNVRGTLAMARTSVVNSATSQFFINVVDNAFLDHQNESPQGFGYCVFGKVVEGMDVVDKIKSVPTGAGGPFPTDAPQDMIEILEISRVP